jgi:hypothetical protein
MENADKVLRKEGQKGAIPQKAFAEFFSSVSSQLSEIQKWTVVYNNFGPVMDSVWYSCFLFALPD